MKKGNKLNSYLNGEWAKHVRKWYKRHTSRMRRAYQKKVIIEHLKD